MKLVDKIEIVLGALFFALFFLLLTLVWFNNDIVKSLIVSDLILMALCIVTTKALKN